MKRMILCVAAITMLSLYGQSVMAASARCVVTEIEEGNMTLECSKEPQGFAKGDAVKIKSVKKVSIEGC